MSSAPQVSPQVAVETKRIRVEGGNDVFGGIINSKSMASRKNKKRGGGTDAEPRISKEVPVSAGASPATSQPAISSSSIPQPTPASQPAPAPSSSQSVPQSVPQLVPPPNQTGGVKRQVKVVLHKPRISHRAVKLAPKKNIQPSIQSPGQPCHKTRKARKITLGVSGLKRRITMAQKIRSKVSSTPIDKLRQELVSKGLLKAGSKTPDDLVRQIASDAQILSKKGL